MDGHILVGLPFVQAFPKVTDALADAFDVVVFDILHLSETLERLARQTFDVGIILTENSHLAANWVSMLETRNSRVEHFIGFADLPTLFTRNQLNDLGLCDCLDSTMTIDAVLQRVTEVARNCRHHPLDIGPISVPEVETGSNNLDQIVIRLIARGMSDREISELLNYSNQSIRNKVSRLLADHGFKNRTELAANEFQQALRRILLQQDSPGADDPR